MTKLASTFSFALLLLTACTSEGPSEPIAGSHEDMVLETIPYDLLGTTKLFFVRGDFTTRGVARWGTVFLDGGSRTADITFGPDITHPPATTHAAVSPATRTLVFMGQIPYATGGRTSDIFVRNWDSPTGTQLEAPATGNARHQPSWSPDGARVIFGELHGWFGSAVRIVSQSLVPGAPDRQVLWSVTNPCESAAGPKQNAAGGVAFIMRWALAGCIRQLSIATLSPGAPHRILYVTDVANVMSLEWSHSGAEIAFVEEPHDGPRGTFRIRVMAADGSNLRTVTTVTTGSGGLGDGNVSLCWARDESRLFFDLPGADETRSHIYTVAVTGGAITPITSTHNVGDRSVNCG